MAEDSPTVAFQGCFELGTASARTELRAGMVWGNYWLIKPLKSAGISEKFSGKRMSDSLNVVLKVLPTAYSQDYESAENYVRHIGAIASAGHPNIPALIEMGCQQNHFYLVFEDVPGECLDEIIKKEGPLPEAEALVAALRIADALAMLNNDFGMSHGCIKPANIEADDEGNVMLLDPGSDKRLLNLYNCDLTETCDTPERADLFGLGVVLFFMLTGAYPYDEDGDPLDVREFTPRVSRETRELLQSILTTEPEMTMDEVVETIESTLDARELAVIEERERIELQKKCDTRRIWLFGGSGVLMVALIIVSIVIFAPRSKPTATPPGGAENGTPQVVVKMGTAQLRQRLRSVIRSYARQPTKFDEHAIALQRLRKQASSTEQVRLVDDALANLRRKKEQYDALMQE